MIEILNTQHTGTIIRYSLQSTLSAPEIYSQVSLSFDQVKVQTQRDIRRNVTGFTAILYQLLSEFHFLLYSLISVDCIFKTNKTGLRPSLHKFPQPCFTVLVQCLCSSCIKNLITVSQFSDDQTDKSDHFLMF